MEMLQHVYTETEFVVLLPQMSGQCRPPQFGWQTAAPREEWWPSQRARGLSASVLAGSPFSPQIGANSQGLEKALGILGSGGLRYRVGMFTSLARPNKSFKRTPNAPRPAANAFGILSQQSTPRSAPFN